MKSPIRSPKSKLLRSPKTTPKTTKSFKFLSSENTSILDKILWYKFFYFFYSPNKRSTPLLRKTKTSSPSSSSSSKRKIEQRNSVLSSSTATSDAQQQTLSPPKKTKSLALTPSRTAIPQKLKKGTSLSTPNVLQENKENVGNRQNCHSPSLKKDRQLFQEFSSPSKHPDKEKRQYFGEFSLRKQLIELKSISLSGLDSLFNATSNNN